MGAKIAPLKGTVTVPGPGAYENQGTNVKEACKSMKFGTGQRAKMEAGPKFVPGPGHVSPDYKRIKHDAPKFGFGSEPRKGMARTMMVPGPGNYAIP